MKTRLHFNLANQLYILIYYDIVIKTNGRFLFKLLVLPINDKKQTKRVHFD